MPDYYNRIPEKLIDTRLDTFYPLLHAMLRVKTTTAEEEQQEKLRTKAMMSWVAQHTAPIFDVLDDVEKELFHHLLDHAAQFHELPTRTTLEDMVRQYARFPEAQLERLVLYDGHLPFSRSTDAVEVEAVLRTRKEVWAQLKFMHVTFESRLIAVTGVESVDRRVPLRKGVPDAVKFLLEQLHSATFLGSDAPTGGSIGKIAPELVQQYQDIKSQAKHGMLRIKTGIRMIDDDMGGLDRKTLNLILGTVGQRKSAVARTIAYYAALYGFRVLFIPLEWSYKEELTIFAMMHSSHGLQFSGTEEMSIKRFQDASLNPSEEEFLSTYLIGSMKNLLQTLTIRSVQDQSWRGIRQLIEQENNQDELDLVVIDYIGKIDCSKGRDTTTLMNQNVQDMKQMCLDANHGRGLVILSPVQGNRKGYEAASANDGIWQATDIYQYSEMEKSADNIMFTFMPKEMKQLNTMKIGFCKTRRHGPIMPRIVAVNPRVGVVGDLPGAHSVAVTKAASPDGFLSTKEMKRMAGVQ